jgi:GntR family transcriptional regulator, carbon starvation induced regulator
MMPTLNHRAGASAGTDVAVPRTLVERAYLALRHDVVCGKLAPGERLRVEHLKDSYGVGAGTLREALALLVSDALITAEGQRGFHVTAISLSDLEDVTATRVMIETEALRQSIRNGDAQWEANLKAAYQMVTQAELLPGGLQPENWEAANKNFHEALIAAHHSPWSKYLLGILYRQSERYRHVVLRLGADKAIVRDVHQEHTDIFNAAIGRQEARAALALESHIRLTHELLRAATLNGQFRDAESESSSKTNPHTKRDAKRQVNGLDESRRRAPLIAVNHFPTHPAQPNR